MRSLVSKAVVAEKKRNRQCKKLQRPFRKPWTGFGYGLFECSAIRHRTPDRMLHALLGDARHPLLERGSPARLLTE